MFGLMQDRPLMISGILRHAARNHATQDVISVTVSGKQHRYGYAEMERRCRRLARVLATAGDRRAHDRGRHVGLERVSAIWSCISASAGCGPYATPSTRASRPTTSPSSSTMAGIKLLFADLTFARR